MTNDLEQFFYLLFGRVERYLPFIEIRAIAPDWFKTDRKVIRFWASSVDAALEKIEELRDKPPYNLYFGVLPRYKKTGGKDAITKAATLWTDIDVKDVGSKNEARFLLARASGHVQCNPAIIVDSANGLHGYWLLQNPIVSLDDIETSNRHIASFCNGDRTHDCSRVLRIPNTLNWKEEGNPKICQIISIEPDSLLKCPPCEADSESQPKTQKNQASFLPERLVSLDPSLNRLSPLWQRYVRLGTAADMKGFYKKANGESDKSRLDFAVVQEMLKKGYSEEEIYLILTNPEYGISEKTLSKPQNALVSYVSLTIENAQKRLCRF